ncbi:MAG: aminoacyl-histidine dipeptidase [Proteiniphilum sp.]|jgi:dipeptidase D|nr:aminoacyl-histidine dipeptidase [Proteiniphilum sp.]NCD14138.1 aminoacyl-histidine dipeptidase [Bacteroidia bacterium]HHT34814.1 aminoacyl-histidine dipeptidase [Bacteroidales bacterium]MDD2726308.1 aminoacyl-histidine dipeptidase [Proteiniphilum sp.]MDD3332189.1 aminoacyl-histidine dipeptidase [Proteiniphilum sp.]
MATTDLQQLTPQSVWKHFHSLTRIPRPTGQMKEVTRYVIDFGKGLNLETRQDKVGNVVIHKPATKGYESAKTVILQSHLDMVPQKNSDVSHDFAKDPIQAYVDGEWVKARSTTLGADNGIGCAMMMALLEDETLEHPAIEALFTIDEEVGMDGANGLEKGFLQGSLMLNLDTEEDGELCIGCAGGRDVNVSFRYKPVKEIEKGDIAFKVSLRGLKGGHSGVQIHLGRANANKLMNRFLKDVVKNYEARVAAIQGGSLRNAIPRESFVVLTIPEQLSDDLLDLVAEYEELFRNDFAGIEEGISFKAERTDLPKSLIPEEIQDDLINAVEGCPNGVISYLADFPGVVESSLNLALVQSSDEGIDVKLLVRSSSESRKDWVCSSVESLFMLAGAKVEFDGDYPGWQPNAHSELLHTMERIYLEKFDQRPKVMVIHAGLECGIIQSNVGQKLDIVSFGPTITGAHSPDEAVKIETVARSYDYLVAILAQLN